MTIQLTNKGLINQAPAIHPTAIIAKEAKIGARVEIGPYSCIGPNVEIKDNTFIGPHVIIEGKTEIGPNCRLVAACSIGLSPQDINYKGEETGVKIGENTIIRDIIESQRLPVT